MKFERAVKKKRKLKMALTGVSGSGKTRGALILAFSMFEKVCVIDTERGTASLYADKFPPYDTYELEPPYSPERYIEAIRAAEDAGYECVIIDSLSHEWNKRGGCLQMVDAVASKSSSGNTFTAWGKVTPKHDELIDCILGSKINIIVTMRSDTQYEIRENEKGKKVPVKIGLAPVQRKDVDFEFDIVFDLFSDRSNRFECSKDRTSLFSNMDVPVKLSDDIGKKIMAWLESGVEIKEEKKVEQTLDNFETKARVLYKEAKEGVIPKEQARKKWNALLSDHEFDDIDPKIHSAFNSILRADDDPETLEI